jgi:hypothetical protein
MPKRDYSIDLAEIRAFDKEPAHTYWHVLDRVSYLGWPTENDAKLKKALAVAPEGVRLFWLSQLIEGPVENGGFRAYFVHRPPLWLDRLARKTIVDFGCPNVVKIVEEAERYMARVLAKRLDPKQWGEATGPVVMEKATRRIHRRFFRALSKLHHAREKYLQQYPERFATPRKAASRKKVKK